MVKVSRYEEVKDSIINSFKRKMIIPVLGSGFTRNCSSKKGIVPSGDDYKKYMIVAIENQKQLGPDEISTLKGESFSSVSDIYKHLIPVNEQQNYLRNHFKDVIIEDYKIDFLSIDWPYIYTLNIDDAIECNSKYKTVIYSNRKVRDDIFSQNNCVIKLHGDINDILAYEDSNCEIFDQTQYVISIKKNEYLLSKLTHDYEYINLLFIGCSLSDEIDILYSSASSVVNKNSRYFCTTKEPTNLEIMKLQKYGITDCLIFDSFTDIYTELVKAYEESGKVTMTDIDNYKAYQFSVIASGFELNKPFMFYGKNPINKDKTITLPNFFINRELTDTIIRNIDIKSVQLIIGNGCSGKTYIAIDIIKRIRDRDVFFFESTERINEEALAQLIDYKNCVVIVDSKSLNIQQLERIIRSERKLKRNSLSFIIFESKSNKDLSGVLSLLEATKVIRKGDIPQFEIKNKFSKTETNEINNLLVMSGIQVFSEKRSLVDNIINSSNDRIENHRFLSIKPKTDTVRDIASLIILATRKKAYSKDGIDLDVINELNNQTEKAAPLIEYESTWSFERDAGDNSPVKYVVNAEYWLNNQLLRLSKNKHGRKMIVDAYKYIVSRYIQIYGRPELLIRNNDAKYKDIIMFDAIIQIFGFDGMELIRDIYEALGNLISTDPNYVHQRAKCYIRSTRYENNKQRKIVYLTNASRDAGVAYSVFKRRYDEHLNEKIKISMAHTKYTEALAACHLIDVEGFSNVDHNSSAIKVLYDAILSPYNSSEYANQDVDNYGNVLKKTVNTVVANTDLVDKQAQTILGELFRIISNFC